MNEPDLVRKVGEDTYRRYRCLPHDAFDDANMTFIGLSPRGTPVWINRLVAEADFRVAVGRVGPHNTHGYEGASKMITPATSYWLTVLRNHSTNFSPYAEYGSYEHNPSRQDTDDIGTMVGLHYIVNFAVNRRGEPFRGFAGHYLAAHRAGIAWGDRHVWAAETGGRADITLASPGSQVGVSGFGGSYVEYAAIGTRRGGSVIFLNEQPDGERELTPFQREMASWSFDDIFKEHERRDQQRSPREISDRCKAIRGEYYARRPGYHCDLVQVGAPVSKATAERRGIRTAASVERALAEALEKHGRDARVLVLPEAATTLPLERLHTFG
jgi:nickel-dependent lactate racemase